MKDNLDIDKLFKDKFDSFEPKVSAEAWQNVASTVSGSTGAVASGIAIWLKGVIIGAVATFVGIGTWLYFEVNEQTTLLNTTVEIGHTNTKTDNLSSILVDSNEENKNEETKLNEIDLQQNLVFNEEDKTVKTKNDVKQNEVNIETQEINNNVSLNIEPNNDANNLIADTESQINTDNLIEDSEEDNSSAIIVVDELLATVDTEESLPEQIYEKEDLINQSFINEIPNVITPNGDRINDEFFIKCENLETFYIVIYTPGNVKIFESYQANFKWKGYDMGGNMVEKGRYYYLIKATGQDAETYSVPGQIYVK